MISIAVIGCGRWGQNLIRVFGDLQDAHLIACCNKSNDEGLRQLKVRYPNIETTHKVPDVLASPRVDAIVIATPDQTHFEFAKQALDAGKHVFVEKPLALSLGQAKELVDLADSRSRVLMTGHILQYHPAIRWIKERLVTEFTSPVSVLSRRVEFGIARGGGDLLWSSAIHDVSVIQYLLQDEPEGICGAGASLNNEGAYDVLFINLLFRGGVVGHIYAGFAGPHRERRLVLHTMREIIVLDGLTGSLELFTRQARLANAEAGMREYNKQFDKGRRLEIPNAPEPLKLECQHFLDCIKTNQTPLSGGEDALAVIRTLDRIERALQRNQYGSRAV
jgi:UDP-2-acetamido-3-amino-2,3-dideoxy-glucuronate N-acetyltransferase